MRTIPALLVTIGLAASLTACASSGAGTTPSSCNAPGAASESVTATGAFGKEPDVSVPSGLTTKGTQVSVLRHGDGREIEDGTPVLIEYTLVDGSTGKVAQTSGYSGKTAPITAGSTNAGALGDALECANVGDRLAVALPQSALSGGTTSGGKTEDAVIAVIDVKRAFDARATGTPQLAGDHMPAVVLAPDGAPGITIPSWTAPSSDETHLLRKGHGEVLTAKDTAVIKYTAVTWGSDSTGTGTGSTVAGSSWTDGTGAQTVPLAKGQVQEGVRSALVGRKVGDQVLAIVHQQGVAYAYVIDVLGSMRS